MKRYFVVTMIILSSCGEQQPRSETRSPSDSVEAVDPLAAEVATAKKLLLSKLKDPASAQFRNVIRAVTPEERLTDAPESPRLRTVFCGDFNSKNTYGGYSGFSPFAVVLPSTPGAGDAIVHSTETTDSDYDGQAAAQGALSQLQCGLGEQKTSVTF